MSERRAIEDRFPKLAVEKYTITSPRTDDYNCVAWIARDIRRWWHPNDIDGFYWPAGLGEGDTLADYIRLFEHLGFCRCLNSSLEGGYEKIAIYGEGDDFEHVAFQREDGTWSSKLGQLGDIQHDELGSLHGPAFFEYPPVIVFMRRPREPHPLAERGLLLP